MAIKFIYNSSIASAGWSVCLALRRGWFVAAQGCVCCQGRVVLRTEHSDGLCGGCKALTPKAIWS
jgi:hypothetical protein